jgi:hypothetical protein
VNQSPEVLAAASHGFDRSHTRGFAGGRPCGKQGYACADNKGEHDGTNRKRDGAWAAGDVERIHRGAHQFDRHGGHHAADRNAEQRAAYAN